MPPLLKQLPKAMQDEYRRRCGGDWTRVYVDRGELKVRSSTEVQEVIEASKKPRKETAPAPPPPKPQLKPAEDMFRVELPPEGPTAAALKRAEAPKRVARKPVETQQVEPKPVEEKPQEKSVEEKPVERVRETGPPSASFLFGRRVCGLRHHQGLSKIEVCRLLALRGVYLAPQELMRIENPHRMYPHTVTLDEAMGIARVLGMSIEQIMEARRENGPLVENGGAAPSPHFQAPPAAPPDPDPPPAVEALQELHDLVTEPPEPTPEPDVAQEPEPAPEPEAEPEPEPAPEPKPKPGFTRLPEEQAPPPLSAPIAELLGRVPVQILPEDRPAVMVTPARENRPGLDGGKHMVFPGTGICEDPHLLEGNAFQLLRTMEKGIPAWAEIEYFDEVTGLPGVDLNLLESACRKPSRVEIAAETYGKKWPVIRFHAGDVCVVVGFRQPRPMVIAAYYTTLLGGSNHDRQRTGGGGKRRQIGVPTTVPQLRNRLRDLGIQGFDPDSDETQQVSFRGVDLGKVKITAIMSKDQIEATYQRFQRKVQAVINRRTEELTNA